MICKIKRDAKPEETKIITIYIGEETYRLRESIDGKLTINKTSNGETEDIRIYPRYANEIEIS